MAERKGNKNSQRSRKLIKQSFFNLLQTKDVEKITVTDVINDAEISRATFYAHYSDINDLLICVQEETVSVVDNHLQTYGLEKALTDPASYFNAVSAYLYDSLDSLKTVAKSRNSAVFFSGCNEKLKKSMLEQFENYYGTLNEKGMVTFNLLFNAIFTILFDWLRGEMNVSYGALVDGIAEMLSGRMHAQSAYVV